MAETVRSTRMAIVEETTEGTPVQPTAGSQYIALQEGFSMTPAFSTLENAEIKASIGKGKPIQGEEAPTVSISHYLRHSGVEGTAPNYDLLLQSAFGAKATKGTERDTVGGSTAGNATTRATIVVDSGEGAEFPRGAGLLIKDGANGYNLRPVFSVSTDTLNLGFNLTSAPASGVNLGKFVLYKPADSGHKFFSAFQYDGNGGALELVAGCRVTEFSVEAAAGELVNASFSMSGLEYFFNPITLAATDTKLDFTDDAGTAVATIAAGTYKDPHSLAAAIQTSMRAVTSTTPTVTFSDSTGKFTIKTTGTVLSLLWFSGGNAANTIGDKIGFVTASDDTGTAATTGYTSDNALSYASPQTPALDTADPLAAKNHEVMLGSFNDFACAEVSNISISMSNELTDVKDICAVSAKSGKVNSGRAVTVSVTATLNRHDADKFRRFRENSDTSFQYSFGTKSGGNWEAGKSGFFYMPTSTITSLAVTDQDGLFAFELELQGYVDSSGNGEAYLNFL